MPADTMNLSLPYNMDAEQCVLGCVLKNPDCMMDVLIYIKNDAFYIPMHREIFLAMETMFAGTNSIIDPVTVADVLAKSGSTDLGEARQYLLELTQLVPSTANVEKYAQLVREQFYLRKLITLGQELVEEASQTGAEANKLIERAEQNIYDIRQGRLTNGPEKLFDVVGKVYDKLVNMTGENAEQYKGIPSGFGGLDYYTTGLNKSDFILIGARPAMGKTSFALNLAQNITIKSKKKCVFFSLEMSKEQLAERFLASLAGVSSKKFRTGVMSDDEWRRIGNAAGELADVPLYLDDASSITVQEIKSRVRRLHGVECVIIDYLGLIQPSGRVENRVQAVSEITRNLKMMAKDLNIPVICCAQLNRGTEGRGKSHRPQLADLRESGSIEQDADIVMFLYRKKYYNEDGEEVTTDNPVDEDDVDESITELIVAKNRHGEVGTVKLTFDEEFTRFNSVENVRDYN